MVFKQPTKRFPSGEFSNHTTCKEPDGNHQVMGKVRVLWGTSFIFVAVRKHSDQKKFRGGIGLFQHNLIILLLSLPFCQEFETLDGQTVYFVSYISACTELLAFLPIPLLSLTTEM